MKLIKFIVCLTIAHMSGIIAQAAESYEQKNVSVAHVKNAVQRISDKGYNVCKRAYRGFKNGLQDVLQVMNHSEATDLEIQKFMYRYITPQQVDQVVDAQLTAEKRAELEKNGFVILQDYVLKDRSRFFPYEKHVSFYRLLNALRLQRFIKYHGLDDTWQVPEKHWSDKHNMVVAKKVKDETLDALTKDKDGEITQAEAQWLMKKAELIDLHDGNLLYDADSKKIMLIDTGVESFAEFLKPFVNFLNHIPMRIEFYNGMNEQNRADIWAGYAKVVGIQGNPSVKQLNDFAQALENKSMDMGFFNLLNDKDRKNICNAYAQQAIPLTNVNEALKKYDDRDIDFDAVKRHVDKHNKFVVTYELQKQMFQAFDNN